MKSKSGFSLVEVLIVVLILALLAAMAIPNLMRAKATANESAAQATLKTIGNSLENFSSLYNVYPTQTTMLIGASPPYLNVDYFAGIHHGYTYTSALGDYFYTITASPSNVNVGSHIYRITTGGVLQSI